MSVPVRFSQRRPYSTSCGSEKGKGGDISIPPPVLSRTLPPPSPYSPLQSPCGESLHFSPPLPPHLETRTHFFDVRGPSGQTFNFTFHRRGTDEQIDELGRLMVNACKLVPGGVVCFVASYGYLDQVAAFFSLGAYGKPRLGLLARCLCSCLEQVAALAAILLGLLLLLVCKGLKTR